jgi:ABC-type transport system involved in cytochrome bd biosynthesis fused ATPase/permease subunit
LLAALLGFLPPDNGRVDTPDNVAWAPQEPHLVSTTVAENLRLAAPEATDDELRRALDLAVLHDVELDTVLGSAGAGLSGGQAQRVALARALLAAPAADLVLLDEPTAHLDEPTARKLRANLRKALHGRTVVHVTHQADEAADADLVYEVREGRVMVSAVSTSVASLSTAQLPAGRTAGRTKYIQYEDLPAAHPDRNLDPPIDRQRSWTQH